MKAILLRGWVMPQLQLQYLFQQLPEYLQIGGDETTGKGICRIVKRGA